MEITFGLVLASIMIPFSNSSNCDSVITINLTINNSSLSVITQNVCDSLISPSGRYVWTSSGVYRDTIPNHVNCDSIITTNLTVYKSTTHVLNENVCDSLVSPSGQYVWVSSGIYMDTIPNSVNCDSIITVDLTIKK